MPVAKSLPGLHLCWWLYQSLSAAGQYCVTHKHIHTNTRNNTSLGLQLCWWSFYSLSAAYQYCVTHKHIHTNTSKQHITRAAAVLVVFLQPFCSLSVLCTTETLSHKYQKRHITNDYSFLQPFCSLSVLCPGQRNTFTQTPANNTSPRTTAELVVLSHPVQFLLQLPATNSSKPHTTKAAVCTVFSDLV